MQVLFLQLRDKPPLLYLLSVIMILKGEEKIIKKELIIAKLILAKIRNDMPEERRSIKYLKPGVVAVVSAHITRFNIRRIIMDRQLFQRAVVFDVRIPFKAFFN